MTVEISAVYENGVLKPDQPLPLDDKQRVRIIVRTQKSRAEESYGLLGWTGDPKLVEQVALDPDLGILESP